MFFRKYRARRTPVVNPFTFGFTAGSGYEAANLGKRIPIGFLERLIPETHYGNMIRLESDHMAEIETSVRENGWTEPLTLAIDEFKVCLQDGHHRVVIAGRLDLPDAPVVFVRSRGINKHSLPLRELTDLLW